MDSDNFGQYRLLDRIASGGMGEVFRAKLSREGGFEKTVAVKRILPSLSENTGFEEQFCAEARLAARLSHANITHVYDFGSLSGSLFLAMEFVEGVDLGTLLSTLREKEEYIQPVNALKIVAEICKGLDYAHRLKEENGSELNLIHRDISPSNILISLEGEVKLTDFGLAKAGQEAALEEKIAGKYSYLPPEQVLGEPQDRRSDIYSLGLVLYEMLYCKKAFPSEIPKEALLKSIAIGAIDFPAIDNVPQSTIEILKKACAKDSYVRFSTAREMLHAVESEIEKIKTIEDESLSRLLKRLYPEKLESHNASPERTILSDRPIMTAEDIAEKVHKQEKKEQPKSRIKSFSLIGFSMILVLAVAFIAYLKFGVSGAILQVNSIPEGATVFVNDKNTGKRTPVELKRLKTDTPNIVQLELKDHEPYTKEVKLKEGEIANIDARLARMVQAVRIETEPDKASVVLNGKKLKRLTPIDIGSLPIGVKNSLNIEKEGYVPFRTEFIIDKKEENAKLLKFQLKSLYKDLEIITSPSNASLIIDNRRISGESPFSAKGLLPNRPIKIICSNSGYLSKTLEVIPSRQKESLKIALQPFKATLQITGNNAGKISVNGKKKVQPIRIANAQKKIQLISIEGRKGKGRLILRIGVEQKKNGLGVMKTVGVLNLDAQPWAKIRIDNGKEFTTPSSGHRINVGNHKISYRIGNSDSTNTLSLKIGQ